MNREDIEKLLGGFATGSLTKEEEQALFSAALEDQRLFDELAREQTLRDLLDDPAARASLLAHLSDSPAPWYRRLGGWVTRPRNAAVMATACAAIALATWQLRPRKQAAVLTAEVKESAPVKAFRDAPASPTPAMKAALPPRRDLAAPSARPVKQRALAAAPPVVPAPPAAQAAPKEAAPLAATVEAQNSPRAAPAPVTLDGPVAGVVGGVAPPPAQKAAGAAGEGVRAAKDVTNGLLPMAEPVVTAPPQGLQLRVAAARLAIANLVAPVSWTVLRKEPDGSWRVANSADLPSGDPVTLRLEAKKSGYIYVVQNDKLLTSSAVQPGKPFDASLEAHAPGRRDLQVWFSPRLVVWPAAANKKAPVFRQKEEDSSQQQPIQEVRLTLVYK